MAYLNIMKKYIQIKSNCPPRLLDGMSINPCSQKWCCCYWCELWWCDVLVQEAFSRAQVAARLLEQHWIDITVKIIFQSFAQPILADIVGTCCSAPPTETYNSCEMNGCTHPKQLEKEQGFMSNKWNINPWQNGLACWWNYFKSTQVCKTRTCIQTSKTNLQVYSQVHASCKKSTNFTHIQVTCDQLGLGGQMVKTCIDLCTNLSSTKVNELQVNASGWPNKTQVELSTSWKLPLTCLNLQVHLSRA